MASRCPKASTPYPMIAVSPNGDYWLEASEGSKRPDPRCWISKEDCDKSAKTFANQFKGQEHQNYYGLDSTENPIVISVKLDPNGFFDVVIRTNEKTEVACVKESQAPSDAKLTWLSQQARISQVFGTTYLFRLNPNYFRKQRS